MGRRNSSGSSKRKWSAGPELGGSALRCFCAPFVLLRLKVVGVDDGRDQAGEAGLHLGAARGVVHLDAFALGANQAGLTEHLEVLREGGFGDRPVDDVLEG